MGMRPNPKFRKAETMKVGAEARLLHSEFRGPAQSALATVQQALAVAENMIARQMARMDGISLDEGWRLNLDTMEWVKPKVQLPEN
jgi:hypothetical protein